MGQEPVEEREGTLRAGKSSRNAESRWCKAAGCLGVPALVLRGEEQGHHFLVLGCIRIENNHGSETKPAQLNRCKSSGRHGLKPGQAAPMQITGYPGARRVRTEGGAGALPG